MKTKFLIAGLTAALALAFTPAQAAKPPAKTPATPAAEKPADTKAKKDTYPLKGEVVAVTPKLLTIKGGKDKPDRKFDITADTKIVNGDAAATIADVKVGKRVGGYVKKAEGAGNPTLLKINVGVPQEDKPKKAADAKAK